MISEVAPPPACGLRSGYNAGMLTKVLGVATALLALLVIHQYNQIADLRAQIIDTEKRAIAQARSITADSMDGTDAEVLRTTQWLNGFYKAADGLQRPEGIWKAGEPDYEGLGHWIFDVYLRNRLRGKTEEEARKDIEDQIRTSDEWRTKHAARN
jgi:hypothetical protein